MILEAGATYSTRRGDLAFIDAVGSNYAYGWQAGAWGVQDTWMRWDAKTGRATGESMSSYDIIAKAGI